MNVGGMFVTRDALPNLREADGSLIFVDNFAAQLMPESPFYAATKWWTRGFAHNLAGVVRDDGAVTVVNLSEVRTDIRGRETPPAKERSPPARRWNSKLSSTL
jgi:NAD(P)-dependent dehydrogenase (short-subunit alcohol dehydrogenase family)